jgi:hypothetical protein
MLARLWIATRNRPPEGPFATISTTRNKVDGMGYRELHRMEIEEVVRRWQVSESQRAIARATGLARETVKKYLAAAGDLGLSAIGPPPTERELVTIRQLGSVATQPITRVAPQSATLEAYREQIAAWLDDDHLLLTRVHELQHNRSCSRRMLKWTPSAQR